MPSSASVSVNLQFPAPPTIFTHREAVSGSPFSTGLYHIDRPRFLLNLDAFGFYWRFSSVPVGVGQTPAPVTIYEEPLAQVLEVKTNAAAELLNGRHYDLNEDEGYFYFSEFPLVRLTLQVWPATVLEAWWMVIF